MFCLLSILGLMAALGQGVQRESSATSSAKTRPSIPETVVDVSVSARLPLGSTFPAVFVPMRCTSNGDLFVRLGGIADSRVSQARALVEFRKRDLSSVVFGAEQMADLREAKLGYFFVDDFFVYVLVRSIENHEKQKATAVLPDGSKREIEGLTGIPRQHLAVFDHDGKLRRLESLDLPFRLTSFGVFPSGEILAAGIDDAEASSRVAILSSEGVLRKYVELAGDLSTDSKDIQSKADREFHGSRNGALKWALLSTEIVPFRDKLLLMWRGQKSTVFEVGAGGNVRAVALKTPEGYSLFAVLANDREWIGELTVTDRTSRLPHETTYIFDPDTGDAIGKLRFSSPTGFGLACVGEQEFLGLRVDPKAGNLIFLTMQPQH